MTRTCTNCKTPISSHVLVVDNKDFHRKTCYCYHAGHKVEGDRSKPQACKICEPGGGGKTKKVDRKRTAVHTARPGRAVMLVS